MKKILRNLLILAIFLSFISSPVVAYAKEEISINDMAGNINTDELDEIVSSLSEDQKSIFNANSFKDKLLSVINGESSDGLLFFVFTSLNLSIKDIMPFIFSLFGICIASGIMKAFCGDSTSGVYTATRFIFILLCCTILFSQLTSVIFSVKDLILDVKKQIDSVFPVLLTLMSAIGSSKSVTLYQPVIAILSTGVMKIVTVFVLPCFILSVIFEVTSHLSNKINLKNLSTFFSSSMKWLLGTAFFVFLSFLSVKGITASVYDGIHIRATKFALNKYIPIIGGYLSEGYNLVLSGGVILKNGVGLCAIILLLSVLLPISIKILLLSLSTDLLSALAQPIGAEEVSSLFKGISKSLKNLLAIVFGASFLYFIFLVLIICTGNSSL